MNTQPTTIAEAFATWTALLAAEEAAQTEDAANAISFQRNDIERTAVILNAGAEHLFLALNSRAQLARMQYDLDAGRSFKQQHGLVTVTLAYRENDRLLHARNAFATGGVLEDPATGAAAAALAGMLRDHCIVSPGGLTILQGMDMGRPLRITVRFGDVKGSPVFVSGDAAKIV